ncbi:MAG: hypothetical protein HUJ16_10470 [Kangiella sp.]|nr:hypothetical protein [Kangiella sp.]
MKKYLIECDFELCSSHGIQQVGLTGGMVYKLDEIIDFDCPLGYQNTAVSIVSSNESVFKVEIKSLSLIEGKVQEEYIQRLAKYLSFLVAKEERNVAYGMPYIKVNYDSFKVMQVKDENNAYIDNDLVLKESINMTDSLSITGNTNIKLKEYIQNINYNELLDFYFSGLKAESEKSKFFHWFMIIESLEGCERYSEMFPKGTMFTEAEKEKIKSLANTFSNSNGKNNALMSVLAKTSASRAEKLFEFISALGIKELNNMHKINPVTLKVIQSIINARNRLFHRGSKFSTKVLWCEVFPLVTKIVELTTNNESCLMAMKCEQTCS